MKVIFWSSLAGILYTYVGYPLAIWMLASLHIRKTKFAPIELSMSIVVAVHNGIERIQGKIQHLLNLDYGGIKEIIVVSDGSTDGTAEFLACQQSSRIKTVILKEHAGKAVAVNSGVAVATGELVLFVDIRPEIAPGAVQQLVNRFADAKVGCVAGELVLLQEGHDATSEAVGGLYWRYEQWIRRCEAAFDSPVGVYGGFYAIRRELFVQMPSGLILDDMFQPLSIIRQGYRSALASTAFVFDMWPKNVEGEFHRKVRTLAGNFQLFRLAPWTLTPMNRTVLQLVSHKAMRLLVPYLLVLLLVSSALMSSDSHFFATFAILQAVCWALAVAGLRFKPHRLQRFISPISALFVLNAAAVVGAYKFLFTRGPLWKIWIPSKMDQVHQSTEARNVGQEISVPARVIEVDESSLVQ